MSILLGSDSPNFLNKWRTDKSFKKKESQELFEKYTLYSSKIPNWVKIFWQFCFAFCFAYTLVQNHRGKYFLNTGISDTCKSKRGYKIINCNCVFRQLVKTQQTNCTCDCQLDTSCKKQKNLTKCCPIYIKSRWFREWYPFPCLIVCFKTWSGNI